MVMVVRVRMAVRQGPPWWLYWTSSRVRAWALLLATVSGPPSRSMVIPQDSPYPTVSAA